MHAVFNPVLPYLFPAVYLCFGNSTGLCVAVGPGFVSTPPDFMRSASHPAGPHDRIAPKRKTMLPLLGSGGVDTIFTEVGQKCCDSFTTYRLCRL